MFFHELEEEIATLILDHEKFTVETLPLDHRVYTNGYLFREKVGKRKNKLAAVANYGVDVADMENLKQGKDIQLPNGDWVETTVHF